MDTAKKQHFFWLQMFILLLIISACDTTSVPTQPTPTAPNKATPITTPGPTGQPVTEVKTYKGYGYTLEYPQQWIVTTGNDGLVSFSDPQGPSYLTITVIFNAQQEVTPMQQVESGLRVFSTQVKQYQEEKQSTVTLAQREWMQQSATGELIPEGQSLQTTMKYVALATNYPAKQTNTFGYTIAYAAERSTFDKVYTGSFKKMLASLTFTQ